MTVDVHAHNLRCAPRRGIKRETAGIGENVQNTLSRSQTAHPVPVVPLVKEKSGFLSADHIGGKTDAVLKEGQIAVERRSVASENGTVGTPRRAFGHRCDFTGETDHHPADLRQQLRQSFRRLIRPHNPRGGVELQNQSIAVLVADESGKTVGFAVNHAPRLRFRRQRQQSQLKSFPDSRKKQRFADRRILRAIGKHLHAHLRTRIVKPCAENGIGFAVVQNRNRSCRAVARKPLHGIFKDPRVTFANRLCAFVFQTHRNANFFAFRKRIFGKRDIHDSTPSSTRTATPEESGINLIFRMLSADETVMRRPETRSRSASFFQNVL